MASSPRPLPPQCLIVEAEQQFATHTLRPAHTVISTLLQLPHDQTLAVRRQHQDDDVVVTSTSVTMAALPRHSTDLSLSEQPSQSAATMVAVAVARTIGGKT